MSDNVSPPLPEIDKARDAAADTPVDDFPVVGIGASAGGLEAFSQLLQALPDKTGMAFVLVQHLDPTHHSALVDLLAKVTPMPVLEASDAQVLQPNRVYIIAPNTALRLGAGNALQVEPRTASPRGTHLPIDQFFQSLADQHQSGAIGVVLSGTGSDGTLGLEQINAAGGITFAQDTETAGHAGMPRSAVQSGCVDLVLPPARIAQELVRIGQHTYVAPSRTAASGDFGDDETVHFKAVLRLLHAANGVDFAGYRDTTVKRRIARRVALSGDADLAAYAERLKTNRAELDALYQDILIGVTSFFRDPAVFEALKQQVFPEIMANRPTDRTIRVWVPGCSSGEEAYSLAMVLLEFLDHHRQPPAICIFATDLSDTAALRKARAGLYPDSIEADVSPERLRRFFTKEDGQYRVNKALRELVVFARQDVTSDPPFSRIDLVSCRNLLIYLSPALQRRVIPTFHYALNPGGFLLLGASESIGQHTDLFTVVDTPHRLYVRKATIGRPYPHFHADDYQSTRSGDMVPALQQPLPADWQREADRVAAREYVPPGVLISAEFEILQFRGQTGPFLAPAAGEPSHNLLKMARNGLFMPLRSAMNQCQKSGIAVRQRGVRVRADGVEREIELHIMPVTLPQASEPCYLVLFEEYSATGGMAAPAASAQADDSHSQRLRQELDSTREYLQLLIEQQEAANEELKSANEEILSSNEELQSTNEELQTAKEELQSVNEELTTVNEQLQHRNTELGRLNDDLTNLLSSSGAAMVVLTADLRIRRFTAAAAKLLGLHAADIGRPVGHLKPTVELPEIETRASEVIASVQTQKLEVRAVDGHSYELYLHPYRTADNRIDGVVLVLFDIDALRRALTALQDQRDYANAIIETVREPLLVLDAQQRVQSANPAFYKMFAVAARDTVGQLLSSLGNGQWNIPTLREQLAQVLTADTSSAEFDIRHDFESIGPKLMRLNARLIAQAGGVSPLILLAIEDRTELARAEEADHAHLQQLTDREEERQRFMALLAHELRNPLAPIRNGLLLLEQLGSQDATPRRMYTMIERQLQQLTRLIDDLLDVTRLDRDTIVVHKQRMALRTVLLDSVEAAQLVCDSQRIELKASLPDEPLWLDGDAVRLAQAFGNVLSNACKYTDALGRVELHAERIDERVSIRVRDSGIGIAADQLQRMFEMFIQGDPLPGRARSGLGIGLALVKQVVEGHGGSVVLRSAGLGHGSELEINLPLAESPAATDVAEPASAGETPAPIGRRVLLVDDNRDSADSMAEVLQMGGHDVRIAYDGQAALRLAAQWWPDVALLDIGLPDMSGHDLARRLRECADGQPLLLLALTGLGQQKDHRQSIAAGFDAHLVKPVDFKQLDMLLSEMGSEGRPG